MTENFFAHLHVHSMYSINDGLNSIEDLIKRAQELKYTHIALTDHGRMGGIIKFAQACMNNGIEGIIGNEIYICDGDMLVKESVMRDGKMRRPRHYHATCLCKNEQGYENLVEISNTGTIVGYYYEPRVDLSVIEKFSKGLVVTSGCAGGMLPRAILEENYIKADEIIDWWRSIFHDDFYLEVQDHGLDIQKKINEFIIDAGKRHKIKIVATNDVHYLYPSDKTAHDMLKNMRINNTENTGRGYATDQFYLKSIDEMYELWKEYPEFCKNTYEIVEKCEYRFPTKTHWKYPEFSLPQTVNFDKFWQQKMPYYTDHQAFLNFLCQANLRKFELDSSKEHKDRLNYELKKIYEMGAEDYFLILWDIFRFCRDNKIAVGPSRGSGGGSLVLYLLEITMIDPLDKEFNLLFERFLNPGRSSQYDFEFEEYPIKQWLEEKGKENNGKLRNELSSILKTDETKKTCLPKILREILPLENQEIDGYYYDMYVEKRKFNHNKINSWAAYVLGLTDIQPSGLMSVIKMGSLPDVDSDFDTNRREEVFKYIKKVYGEDHVISIGTYGQFKIKSALQDALKMQGIQPEQAIACTKLLPDNTKTIEEAFTNYKFADRVKQLKVPQETFEKIGKIVGSSFQNVGAHPAGAVISPHPLLNKIPMHRAKENIVSQFDLYDMEAAGYIKYDFLGLSNVSKISKCLDLIEARYGERLDLRKIPKDDPEALVQFRKKRLATIFQFNKPHIPGIIDDVVIDDFSDIVVINALNRPGPMRYISRRIYEQERSNNLDLEEWQPGITYAENKKNRANIKYVTEDLRPILEQTYGINCYQEQIMEISQKIAGFTMQEADVLRKAIGKKIGSLFEECKEKFFKGARKNGYEDSVIQKIWQQAEDFASYSFNKSHSAAYGLIAYWNAWLLAHFPYEFYAACINEDAKDTKEILLFIKEAITFKPQINIIPPNVNESTYECYVKYSKNGPEAIVLPLTIIKGLGKNVEDIVANRPYKTFNSFCVRNNISASMFLTLLNSYEMFRGDDRKYRIDPLYTATGAFSCFSLNVSQLKIKFREAEEEIKENKKTSKANLEKGISPDLLSLFDVKEKVNSIEMDRKVKKDNLPI